MKITLQCVMVMVGLAGCVPEGDDNHIYSGEECGPKTGIECPSREEIEDWCDKAPIGYRRCTSDEDAAKLKQQSVEALHRLIDCRLEVNALMQRLCEAGVGEDDDPRAFCFDEPESEED